MTSCKQSLPSVAVHGATHGGGIVNGEGGDMPPPHGLQSGGVHSPPPHGLPSGGVHGEAGDAVDGVLPPGMNEAPCDVSADLGMKREAALFNLVNGVSTGGSMGGGGGGGNWHELLCAENDPRSLPVVSTSS